MWEYNNLVCKAASYEEISPDDLYIDNPAPLQWRGALNEILWSIMSSEYMSYPFTLVASNISYEN